MDWQTFVTLLIVLLAFTWLVHRAWKMLQGKKSGCSHGCGGCSMKQHVGHSSPLVSLQGMRAHRGASIQSGGSHADHKTLGGQL